MKDLNQIYKRGAIRADSLLKEANSSAKSAIMSNERLEELTGLIALRNAEEYKYNKFEEKMNNLAKNPSLDNIIDIDSLDMKEAYRTGTVPIYEGVTMPIQDIESLIIIDNFKDKPLFKNLVQKIVGKEK